MIDNILDYKLSPENIKKALKVNIIKLREKINKIEFRLRVTLNQTTYFLTSGPYELSVLIIKKMITEGGSIEYICVEEIINIDVDSNNEMEYLLKL